MRDSQKSKVYEAERSFHRGNYYGEPRSCACPERLEKYDDTFEFVQRLYRSEGADYLRTRHRVMDRPGLVVKNGQGTRIARGSRAGGWVSLPKWARCPLVIAHEVAHTLSTDRHGEDYAYSYYRLTLQVDEWYGTSMALNLASAFEKRGVRW